MSVEIKVKEIVAEVFNAGAEKVTWEARFIEDLGVDSLYTIDLILELEKTFGIKILDKDVVKILKVKDAIKYIEERRVKDKPKLNPARR